MLSSLRRTHWWSAIIPMFAVTLPAPGQTSSDLNVPQFLASRFVPSGIAHPPEHWSATENIAWKTEIPGMGWSSPIVWNDRVFLSTCVSTGKELEPRKGLYIEDLDANQYPPKDVHQFKVYCLNLASGSIEWEHVAHEGVPAKPHHIKNTLASETPCTDGERLFVLFGNLGLFCYSLDGDLLWNRKLTPRNTRMGWGTSMSPVVHQDRVFLVNDNEEESVMMALDKRTGEVIWTKTRDEKTNYSTPFVWENEKRTELVVSGINWLRSYDLDGNELWRIKGHSILAIPTPFAHEGLLYVTSGHVIWGENRIFAIRPGASGDLTPPSDRTSPPDDDGSIQALNRRPKKPLKKDSNEALDEHLAWYQRMGPYHPTPMVIQNQLYMLLDRGFMASFDAKTGDFMYEREKVRIPEGVAFTSSPWSYGGKIFCLNENGECFVVTPGKSFEILYTNKLAEDDMCMATPVIVGDRLLIRTSERLYSIRVAGEE